MLDGLHRAHGEAAAVSRAVHLVKHRNLRITWKTPRTVKCYHNWLKMKTGAHSLVQEEKMKLFKPICMLSLSLCLCWLPNGFFVMLFFALELLLLSNFKSSPRKFSSSYLLGQSSSAESGRTGCRSQTWPQPPGPGQLSDLQTDAECGAPSGGSPCGNRGYTAER